MSSNQRLTDDLHARTKDARKILVVDLGFLGDTLHLVPALWELKDNYPAAKLSVLSGPLGSEVLRLAPCVDRIWTVELHPERRSLSEHLRVLRQIRGERYDLALNFGGADRSIFLTGFSGARNQAVHAAGRKHFWSTWLIPHWVPKQAETLPVYEQRRQFLARLGLKLSAARFDLRISPEDQAWASAQALHGAVHYSLNSANPLKEWPLDHYARFTELLLQGHPTRKVVVSIGRGDREEQRLRGFQQRISDPRVRALPQSLSLGQLSAALRRCVAHFGPDSGVMHLAQALGVRALSLFRNQPGYLSWLPDQAGQKHILAACTCVDHHRCPCETAGQAACLAALTPAEVFQQFDQLLNQ